MMQINNFKINQKSNLAHKLHPAINLSSVDNDVEWPEKMYAIVFDMDTETLEATYHNSHWRNAYADIKGVLETHGFHRQQGSTYFGDQNVVDPITCVMAVQDLEERFAWFRPSVRDIRMLRIEANHDLSKAFRGGNQRGRS